MIGRGIILRMCVLFDGIGFAGENGLLSIELRRREDQRIGGNAVARFQ